MRALTHYLYVPKGEDIRMVYNGTAGGLNDALWDPHVDLPTVASALRMLDRGAYMKNKDIGKMLLNFMLSE